MKLTISSTLDIAIKYNEIWVSHTNKNGLVSIFDINYSGLEILLLCNGLLAEDEIINLLRFKYKLKKNDVLSIKSFIQEYINKGVIICGENEYSYSINFNSYPELIIPTVLILEVTNKCQLRCKHCFNSSGLERKKELDVNKFIEIMKQYKKLGGKILVITGGEPFLKNGIDRALNFALENFTYVSVLSNGYTVPNEVLEIIKNRDNVSVQISIDGKEGNHDNIRNVEGAYKRTIENIKLLVECNVPIQISFTLNDQNLEDLDDVIILSKSLGCKKIIIGCTLETGRAAGGDLSNNVIHDYTQIVEDAYQKYSDDNFIVGSEESHFDVINKYESQEGLNKCGAGYKTVQILSNGDVVMCPMIKGKTLGNVLSESLKEIFNHKNLEFTLKMPSPTIELCGDCSKFDNCGYCIGKMLEVDNEECRIRKTHEI